MITSTPLQFHLREGWTLRQLVTTLVREWLPPFRAVPESKRMRWAVQPIVEPPGGPEAQLWERGISTREYEARLDHREVCWQVRARNGRAKGIILAHLAMSSDEPQTVTMLLCPDPFPEELFDAEKMEQDLNVPGSVGAGELFSILLTQHGFPPIAS